MPRCTPVPTDGDPSHRPRSPRVESFFARFGRARSAGGWLWASSLAAAQPCGPDLYPGARQYGDSEYVATIFEDFDRDGRIDVATIDPINNEVRLLLGRADGTFDLTDREPVESRDELMAAGDFDGDGLLDLIVTTLGIGDLRVLLNTGGGLLTSLVPVPAEPFSERLVTGDFDGDGDLDAMTVNPNRYKVVFYANDGGGALARVNVDLCRLQPREAIAADFDGDGLDDFVVTTRTELLLYRSLGGFRFALWSSMPTVGAARQLSVADVDEDGDIDLVVPAAETHILLNDGRGSFAQTPPLPRVAGRVEFRHVDDDGVLDAVIVGPAGIARGLGGGAFGDLMLFPTTGRIDDAEVADVDGDGKKDLLIGSSDVITLRGTGDASLFEVQRREPFPGAGSILLADLDGDGSLDYLSWHGYDDVALLGYGAGDGTFAEAILIDVGVGPDLVLARDVDADGDLDLVIQPLNGGTFAIVRQEDDGSFADPWTQRIALRLAGVDATDLDDDGDLDLAFSMEGDRLGVLFQDEAGGFSGPVTYDLPAGPRRVAFIDLDLDGDRDLLVGLHDLSTRDSFLTSLFNDGVGGLELGASTATPFSPGYIRIVDVDGDGADDVVGAHSVANSVFAARSRGDGTLAPPASYQVPHDVRGLDVGDVNHDGFVDLAVACQPRSMGSVGILVNRGDGTFEQERRFDSAADPIGIQLGDVDADGTLDVVVPSQYGRHLSILPGRCTAPCRADFDGDGALTIFDFLAFQNAFASGDPIADFDGDGSLTLFDFLAFQNAFDAGCGG